VRGRKLELDHFLRKHGVDICLLSETFLNPVQNFRLAKYVYHCTEKRTAGSGITILVRPGIVHYSEPVPGFTHLETTVVHVTFDGRLLKIIAAYFSPSGPLIRAELKACFCRGLPVLKAGDFNTKHVDWNSRLTTGQGKLRRDYTYENSCLIFGPDTPITNP
jgi:hypothetical protein